MQGSVINIPNKSSESCESDASYNIAHIFVERPFSAVENFHANSKVWKNTSFVRPIMVWVLLRSAKECVQYSSNSEKNYFA